MNEIQWKLNITIKDYFPKLKKISYNEYYCILTYNKLKQIIPFINKDKEKFQFSLKPIKKDLTYLVMLINKENDMTIGESNLIIASFRLKQLKEIKKIKYEQQIKIELNKLMKEKLFGPGINIGNIYIKFMIEISLCENSILMYKLENKNINSNNNNLNSLSLSSFITNLSTLKENKKQNEKKIKNTSPFNNNNIKYLCTEISHNKNKSNNYQKQNKEENTNINITKRKVKIFSPTKIISLKKNKTKWHINRDYLKSINKNISESMQEKRTKNNKLRKAFSNEDIRNSNNNIQLMTEIYNNSNNNISYSTQRKKDIKTKTERTKHKSTNKFKKIIKTVKINDNIQKAKNVNINKNDSEKKKDIISIINDIKIKNKEIIKKNNDMNNSKNILLKEKISYEHKVMNELQNEIEKNNIKNYIHVNINKQMNNLLLNKMTKIKSNELNIYNIIFNQKINIIKNNINPKEIMKEKLKQQQQIQLLIKLIRNLIKIYGNLSHLFDNEQNKQILIKSLFLRYNIKEIEWNNDNDLFDIYEKKLKENKEMYYYNRYQKEKEEFNTIKEEDEEELNTIE